MEKRKVFITALILGLVLALASGALAQLTPRGGMGPINPYVPAANGNLASGNGFPLYIEDINGLQLDLPVPPLAPMVFDPPIDGNQFSQDIGFGAEAFYYLAESTVDVPGGKALLVLGAEAAFGAEDPLNTDQFLFNRVRIRIDTAVAGTYKVIHPWGEQTFTEVPAGDRAINFTYDWGGFYPTCEEAAACLPNSQAPGFERFLLSPTPWVFMQQLNPAPPEGFVGDGTEATITPGFNGVDYFRIEGPPGSNLGGNGQDFIVQDQFTVSGHIYAQVTPPPPPPPPPPQAEQDIVSITRVTFNTRNRQLEIRATSSNNLPLTATWDGGATPSAGSLTNGRLRVRLTAGTPTSVTVVSTSNNAQLLGGSDTKPVPFP